MNDPVRPSEKNTKEKIAQAAASLFAQRGFYAVSIRDICKVVGIKESTVYYHYENKQAILDALLQKIDALIAQKRQAFDQAFAHAQSVSIADMQTVAAHLLTGYLLHPDVHRVLSLLSMEKHHREEAEKRYRRIVFDLPIAQQEKVFQQMMERGMIRPGNPYTIAVLYYGAIYGAYAQYCTGPILRQEQVQAACEQIREAIGSLYSLLLSPDNR